MNKKEQHKQVTKQVFTAIKNNFNVVEDFHDYEGHGYFTFTVFNNDHEFTFDLGRKDFEVIGHLVKGESLEPFQNKLEQKIQHVIDEVVEQSKHEQVMMEINQGLGLK